MNKPHGVQQQGDTRIQCIRVRLDVEIESNAATFEIFV